MKNNAVALIPARSGSKRIPNKNIKRFAGKPMISYPIIAAHESNLFDKIFVSTDSPQIAEIAREFGAEIINLRPNQLSSDLVSTLEVIKYEILQIRENGYLFEYLACIYPGTPMLNKELLQDSFLRMKSEEFDFCFPVVKSHVGPERLFKIDSRGSVVARPNHETDRGTQSLPEVFRDAGQFYWGRSEEWLSTQNIFTENSLAIPVPEYLGIDIDTVDNWKHAELIFMGLAVETENRVNFTDYRV